MQAAGQLHAEHKFQMPDAAHHLYGAPVPGEAMSPGEQPRTYNCGKKRIECERGGCQKVPVFNDPGATRGKFCKAHKCVLCSLGQAQITTDPALAACEPPMQV